jgi:hypothetical protein
LGWVVLDAGLDGGLDTFCEIVYTLCDLLQRGRKDGVQFTKVCKLTGHVLWDLVQSRSEFGCERVDIRWISFSLRHNSSQEKVVSKYLRFVSRFRVFLFTRLSDVELVAEQQIYFLFGVNVPTDDSNAR